MTYKVTEEGNVSTVFLNGEIDMDVTEKAKEVILPLVDSGKEVHLNLKDVSYMDSSGISMVKTVLAEFKYCRSLQANGSLETQTPVHSCPAWWNPITLRKPSFKIVSASAVFEMWNTFIEYSLPM